MATDKVLNKMHQEINDLAPTLELFVHDNIQPSVEDCEKLQKQLNGLQESLAVYKYNKQNKELSPSFNIHAKLSEQEVKLEKKIEIIEEIKATIKIEDVKEPIITEVVPEPVKVEPITESNKPDASPEETKKETSAPKKPLVIGLNDKFRFLNELFSQNTLEYNIALEQLSNLISWTDTEIYLNSLKTLYGWKENNESVKHLYSLAKQRFN